MSITLDSIRAAADAKYGSFDIELTDGSVTKLLNPLRLTEQARAELKTVSGQLSAAAEAESTEDVDQVALFENAIRVVSETPAQADKLLTAVGGDLAILAEIFAGYGEGTQVGEASASVA